jgi:hypothetical protein
MIGNKKLKSVGDVMAEVIRNGVPGNFVESGTWRGGASIYARLNQIARNEPDRHVYLCDSFQGLPKATTKNDGDEWSTEKRFAVSVDQVKSHFESFHAMDAAHVHFVKGFFQFSLPPLRQQFLKNDVKIAVLRGDADMYEGYKDILYNLYEFVPVGGYFICDDCGIKDVMRAVNEFRDKHGITSKIVKALDTNRGLYWKKGRGEAQVDYEEYVRWNVTRKNRGSER